VASPDKVIQQMVRMAVKAAQIKLRRPDRAAALKVAVKAAEIQALTGAGQAIKDPRLCGAGLVHRWLIF